MKEIVTKLTNIYYIMRKHNLNIGKNTIIEGSVQIDTNGEVTFGEKCIIRKWSCFKPYGGSIKIGKNCTINSFCHISGNGGVIIGDNVMIATQCVIISANHKFDELNININEQGETRKGIEIGDNCWIGAGAKILDGVVIGSGCVIGAGSVVTKSVPSNSVCAGVPAKIINKRGS